MKRISTDYEYLGNLLEGIEGSLSEERRLRKPKNANRNLKKIRRINDKLKLTLHESLKNPNLLEKRLAEVAALGPTVSLDFRLKGIQKILGKNQYKKIRNILLYLATEEIPEWLRVTVLDYFLRLVPKEPQPGIQCELVFLATILKITIPQQRDKVLSLLYSENNFDQQIKSGSKLLEGLYWNFLDTSIVKNKIYKRGYSDKGSYRPNSERERRKSMNEISNQIGEVRQRILEKQMVLFERNLDRLLQIETFESREDRLKFIRNQEDQIQQISETEHQKIEGENYERKRI